MHVTENEKDTGLIYTELKTVFSANIYIFDWENAMSESVLKGKRNQSEGTCGIFEYEGLIDKAKNLLK